MKDIARFTITLTIVSLVSACSLAWINEIIKSQTISQEEKDLNDAFMYVLPGSNSKNILPIHKEGQILYYKGYEDRKRTKIIGYAFLVESQGYSSNIRTLVGIDTNGIILRIKILSQQETPGFGTRCEEIRTGESIPWWQAQFQNKSAVDIAVDKDGGQIESISGATITSRAITDSIANRTKKLFENINE